MRIISAQLKNYRCFQDSGEISFNKFSVLIGKNDGGKTSFLKAIDKALNQDSSFSADDCWFQVTDNQEVRAKKLEVSIKLGDSEGNVKHHIRTTYSREENSTHHQMLSKVVDDERLNKDINSYTKTELRDLCDEYYLKYTNSDNKPVLVDVLSEYRDSLPQQNGWLPLSAEVKQDLPRVMIYESIEDVGPDSKITNNLSKYFKDELLSNHQEALKDIREDVETSLNEHAQTNMLKALKEHCKIVENISIVLDEASFSTLKINTVRITQPDGKTIDWDRIGAGRKREMALGIFSWEHDMLIEQIEGNKTDAQPAIILFDEPDINLDYSAQRLVNQLLQRLTEYNQTQVIVATHAVNIIDSVPLENLNFFDHSYKPWRFKFGQEDSAKLETIRVALGLRNSALFNEKVIVIVEGETEMSALPPLYQKVKSQMLLLKGIYLVNGLDKGQALKLATLLKKGREDVVLLLDSDCIDDKNTGLSIQDKESPTEEEIKKIQHKHSLRLGEELFFLGEMEFEDLFSDEVWIAMLENKFSVAEGKTEWQIKDIQSLREKAKFSKAVIDLIEERCCRKPGKPEIGKYIANTSIELNQIPETLIEVFDHITNKADSG